MFLIFSFKNEEIKEKILKKELISAHRKQQDELTKQLNESDSHNKEINQHNATLEEQLTQLRYVKCNICVKNIQNTCQ